jgi:hypothetical protein
VARTKNISYSMAATVNMGNFENVRVEYGETVEVSPEDDLPAKRNALLKRVERIVEEQVVTLREDAQPDRPSKSNKTKL